MNDDEHVKNSSQYSPFFPPVNLFSVPALLCHNSPAPGPAGYIFTFLHQGRSQQAVLEKTFLTGLERDNVRITWEEARRELFSGCDMKIDVTLVKSSPLKEIWLVFGLYFSSINTNFSQFQDVMLSSSRAKFLKFECQIPSKSAVMEANHLKSITNKCLNGDGKIGGEVTLENSTNPQESLTISTLERYVTAVDTSGLVLDDSMDDAALFYSFDSVIEEDSSKLATQSNTFKSTRDDAFPQADQNKEINLSNYELYFESLFLGMSPHSTVEDDIEAQFICAMAANELLENYDEIEKDFENIYLTACSQSCESEANMSSNPPIPSISYNSQLHKKPENHPVSAVAEESLMQSPYSVESPELLSKQGKYGSNSEASFILQPSLTSTPLEKKASKEDSNSCPLFGSNNPLLHVKMDSGYYESFSPASSSRREHDVEVLSKDAKNNLVNLLDFWRGKEKILK